MTYFAGLDVSLEETAICVLEETAICVVDDRGQLIKELRAASELPALIATFDGTRPSLGAHQPGSALADSLVAR